MTVLTAPVKSDLVRIGPGLILATPYGTTLPTTLAQAVAIYTTPGLWRFIGSTTEGSQLSYSQTSDGVPVAERLRDIKQIITGVEMGFEFTMAELNPQNLCLAANADPATNVVTTSTDTTFIWPKTGGVKRTSLLWLADDALEAMVLSKCFAGGDITVPRRKGVDPAAVPVTFAIEDNGNAALGLGRDAYQIFDNGLLGIAA